MTKKRIYQIQRFTGIQRPWQDSLSFVPVDIFPWGDAGGYRPPTTARMAMDDTAFYVCMKTAENETRSVERGFSGNVYNDSCMELFLMPDPAHSSEYFNWEFNPVGAMYLSLGTNRFDREDIVPENYPEMFRLKTGVQADGWTLEYHIPFDFLRHYFSAFEPCAGHFMRGNFYKCGDKTIRPHYGCWSPIDLPKPDFHCPGFFGEMILD
jgi:hypothetical protein